ncbi:hypothetical protein RN001_004548 [Aquatica leii]|uniref:Protein NATD1 n=1 Tax=Aquatica leii TaxID=1421715 RepID=A0AAN7PBH8_9COLE|nr:hypothetical protein RN001_004548 [Aquatica leii]
MQYGSIFRQNFSNTVPASTVTTQLLSPSPKTMLFSSSDRESEISEIESVSRSSVFILRYSERRFEVFDVIHLICNVLWNDYSVEHASENSEFKLQLNANDVGIIEYQKKNNVYKLVHSSVPTQLQGQGYGRILAQKTFDYIASKNYRMSITCPFLLKCYKENEDKYKKYFVD